MQGRLTGRSRVAANIAVRLMATSAHEADDTQRALKRSSSHRLTTVWLSLEATRLGNRGTAFRALASPGRFSRPGLINASEGVPRHGRPLLGDAARAMRNTIRRARKGIPAHGGSGVLRPYPSGVPFRLLPSSRLGEGDTFLSRTRDGFLLPTRKKRV